MTVEPSQLDYERGLMFFHAYMYGPLQGKLRLYNSRNITPRSIASPSDWEVLASFLLGTRGTRSHSGVDLNGYEVKSAATGSAFEYQYHRDSWGTKFADELAAGHLLFSHSNFLKEVRLTFVPGAQMAKEFLIPWRDACPYPSNPGTQRYRKSLPHGWVTENGKMLMKIEDGEAVYPLKALGPLGGPSPKS